MAVWMDDYHNFHPNPSPGDHQPEMATTEMFLEIPGKPTKLFLEL
jgi:hypothetical protein